MMVLRMDTWRYTRQVRVQLHLQLQFQTLVRESQLHVAVATRLAASGSIPANTCNAATAGTST